jgi:hypothetical protein
MQIVYKAKDIPEAHIFSGFLLSHDIDSFVGGHYLQGAIGEIGLSDFAVVRVNDEDYDKARSLVAVYENNAIQVSAVATHKAKASSPFQTSLLVVAIFLISVLVLIGLVS